MRDNVRKQEELGNTCVLKHENTECLWKPLTHSVFICDRTHLAQRP